MELFENENNSTDNNTVQVMFQAFVLLAITTTIHDTNKTKCCCSNVHRASKVYNKYQIVNYNHIKINISILQYPW